jgi:formylglycine-generating enzyme required for sulfatase activity
LAPYYLDETELTVGRMRRLVKAGMPLGADEITRRSSDPTRFTAFCTWLGPDDPANDALPLNCVSYRAAARACEREGGSLPTEAEWEHAARGRGQRRTFPWGETETTCCIASVSRAPGSPAACPGSGVEPAGSHPAKCDGVGDVSRDGVLDMGGSLFELTRDKHLPYDDACWGGSGLLREPVCLSSVTSDHTQRGGSFSSGTHIALAALRGSSSGELAINDVDGGLRCRYPAEAR